MTELITQNVLAEYFEIKQQTKRLSDQRIPLRERLIAMMKRKARVQDGQYSLILKIVEATRLNRTIIVQALGEEFFEDLKARIPKTKSEFLYVNRKANQVRRSEDDLGDVTELWL